MALNKPVLVNEIVKVLKKAERNTTSKDKAQLDLAKGLANAIEKYIRSGTVTTTVITTRDVGTGTGAIT